MSTLARHCAQVRRRANREVDRGGQEGRARLTLRSVDEDDDHGEDDHHCHSKRIITPKEPRAHSRASRVGRTHPASSAATHSSHLPPPFRCGSSDVSLRKGAVSKRLGSAALLRGACMCADVGHAPHGGEGRGGGGSSCCRGQGQARHRRQSG
jgi:hypothetical protein